MTAPARSATPRTRIEEAKARFTVSALWRMFNLPGKPGRSCRSPFREDRSPSFSVTEDDLHWRDFATGDGGDSVHFLARAKGLSSAEAFVELLKMAEETAGQQSSTNGREADPESRRGPWLNGIELCSESDLAQISELRSIPIEGLLIAYERKLLFAYQDPYQGRCWLVTDDARRSAVYRRLDGKRFRFRESTEEKKSGPKSRNWKGSEANWPNGIAQANSFGAIALCEGAPDFLAAFSLARAGAVESLVAPVCMGGAACFIHKDALPMFRGKRVGIFGHSDEAGQRAIRRWAEQLRTVQAEVDGFDFSGLVKADGSPVKDLNDFLLADHEASGCAIEIVSGALDFALERKG